MPKYNYKCTSCNLDFFVYHKVDEKQSTCTQCGSNEIHKIFSNFVLLNSSSDVPVGTHLTKIIEENKINLNEFKKDLKEISK